METDISVGSSEINYIRITPRSGSVAKYRIHILAGDIDTSYHSTINVFLINLGDNFLWIIQRKCIAQLICENIEIPIIALTIYLNTTEQGVSCFGISDDTPISTSLKTSSHSIPPNIVLFDPDKINVYNTTNDIILESFTTFTPMFNLNIIFISLMTPVVISQQEIFWHIGITLHLVWLQSQAHLCDQVQLLNCMLSRPATRISRWWFTLLST